VRAARRFLEEGNKVKVEVRFRGREATYPEVAREQISRIAAGVADIAIVERMHSFEGRAMFAGADRVASSEKTRKNLGWNPTGPGLVADLQANRSACVVVPGDHQSPAVHALAHAMNAALGAPGATVVYTDPVEIAPTDNMASLRDLVADMKAGRVTMLLIVGGNPVYDAPVDLDFADQMTKVPLTAHLGLFEDDDQGRYHPGMLGWSLAVMDYLRG